MLDLSQNGMKELHLQKFELSHFECAEGGKEPPGFWRAGRGDLPAGQVKRTRENGLGLMAASGQRSTVGGIVSHVT